VPRAGARAGGAVTRVTPARHRQGRAARTGGTRDAARSARLVGRGSAVRAEGNGGDPMHVLRRTALATIAIAVFGLAGCGGAAPGSTEPAGVVNSALAAAESGGLNSLNQYACAAQANDVASMFGGGASSLGQLQALGIDPNELFQAVKVDFENIQASEKSKTDTAATVHVTGNAKMTVDSAKFRDIFKKILEAQGLPADEAMIDQAMAMMDTSLSQSQAMDEDVSLIKENGKWVICGS
jgi:hypothetical protein